MGESKFKRHGLLFLKNWRNQEQGPLTVAMRQWRRRAGRPGGGNHAFGWVTFLTLLDQSSVLSWQFSDPKILTIFLLETSNNQPSTFLKKLYELKIQHPSAFAPCPAPTGVFWNKHLIVCSSQLFWTRRKASFVECLAVNHKGPGVILVIPRLKV